MVSSAFDRWILLSYFSLWGNIRLIHIWSEHRDGHNISGYRSESPFCQGGWHWVAAGAGCLEVSLYSCNPTSFDFGFFIPKSMAGRSGSRYFWKSMFLSLNRVIFELLSVPELLFYYLLPTFLPIFFSSASKLNSYFYYWLLTGTNRPRLATRHNLQISHAEIVWGCLTTQVTRTQKTKRWKDCIYNIPGGILEKLECQWEVTWSQY